MISAQEQVRQIKHGVADLIREEELLKKIERSIKENKPCPVCGSLNHPQLATSAVVVEASVLEAAEQKLQVLEQARIKQQ